MRTFFALFVLAAISIAGISMASAAAIIGGGTSTQYTCTKEPGKNPTCTCTGGLDCIMMCKGKVCKDGCDVLSCSPDGNSCTCDWKQSVRPSDWKRLIAPVPGKLAPMIKRQ